MRASNVRAPRGHLRQLHWRSSPIPKRNPSKVLLANNLYEVSQEMRIIPKHADWSHAPPEDLHFISNPWPFHTWGIDILGPFPFAIRQMKYLIVAIEYFTKWTEVEPVTQITAQKIQHFVWKNVVCRFGVPRHLVSDKRTQFASR